MLNDTRCLGGSASAPVPIALPCAWYARELQTDKSWIWQLEAQHIAEIDYALQWSKQQQLDEQQVTRVQFPLPSFDKVIAAMVNELEFGRGVVLMRGLPVERYSENDLRRIYWGIGTHIGNAESQNIKGERMQRIADHGFDYRLSEHRGSMTSAELRPHCDITDMVGLLCVRSAQSGGLSTIRSSMTIYNEVLEQAPELLQALHRGFHFELDGKGPTGHPNETTHRIPTYSWYQGYLACRYNQKAIEGGAVKAGAPLTALEQRAINFIGEAAVRNDVELSMELQPGDIQWLNNYVILHSRTRYEDAQDANQKRLLLRLWLNHDNARPLDDNFANKALNGPRKGVAARHATYDAGDLQS